MKIYTLNVGQGQFGVVVGTTEAVIVDTSIQTAPTVPIINVKGALFNILQGRNLIGLMITGFDADHFNEIGVQLVLNKYRPNWIMYPRYFKESSSANAAFGALKKYEGLTPIQKHSISLSEDNLRFYNHYSNDFFLKYFRLTKKT